ncbi:integrase, catalytic region, zinc finger, CCHC-type containing protein [Tanacetum coccineum]
MWKRNCAPVQGKTNYRIVRGRVIMGHSACSGVLCPKRKRDEQMVNDKSVAGASSKQVIALMAKSLQECVSDALTEDKIQIIRPNTATANPEGTTLAVVLNYTKACFRARDVNHSVRYCERELQIKISSITSISILVEDFAMSKKSYYQLERLSETTSLGVVKLVNECQKCLELKTELLNKWILLIKKTYDKLVRLSTSASGSQPSGNTRNDRILQTPSSNSKNKVEAHPRNVKSSLNKRNSTVQVNGSASVQNSKKHDNSDYVCINGDDYDCMSSDNLCVSNSMNDVKFRAKPKKSKSKKRKSKKDIWKPTGKVFTKIGYIWRPTGRTFTIVGNACPLTRITTTNEVPSRKPIVLESESPKPVVNLVYSRKPRKNKNTESVSKTKVVQIVLWYLDSGCSKHMTGDRSQLTNFISKFLGTVKFGNDQVAKIMGYGDYQIGNVTISRVYYVEGLGHNLFSVGQFCDSNLEVAFRQHTCFIRNLEGVDLLTGSRGDNLYTLSLGNMMASSPICLLSKASKTKSWLWHRRLSHLNFGAINHLARHGLVRGLPKLKFEKDHLCSACALGKSSKKPHKPKSEDTNQEPKS